MAYVKKDWEDLPNQTTPVTASDLDRMENGIENNDQRLNGTKAIDNTIYVNDVKCKNLYDANTMLLTQGLWSGGYTSIETNSNGWYVVVPVKENTTYNISKKYTNNDNNALNCWITITSQYPANGVTTLINFEGHSSQTSWSITTPTGAKYLFLGLLASSSPSNELKVMATSELQVEIGDEATTYTPYKKIIKEENGYVKEDTIFYANDFKCRNLFNYSGVASSYYHNGITFTNNGDGTITANGTASGVAYWDLITNFKGIGNYTLSGCPSGGGDNTYKQILMRYSDYNGVDDTGNGATRNLDSGINYGIRLRIASGYVCNNIIFKPMLEIGDEVTSYIPFIPIGEEIYSTNEIRIGTWINGKPLYRKAIYISGLPNSAGQTNFLIDSNIKIVNPIKGYVTNGTLVFPFNVSRTTASTMIGAFQDGVSLTIEVGMDRSTFTGYAVIEYTKTTD